MCENSTVDSVVDSDLMVVSSSGKNIYREIEQDQKQEAISKRDEWGLFEIEGSSFSYLMCLNIAEKRYILHILEQNVY